MKIRTGNLIRILILIPLCIAAVIALFVRKAERSGATVEAATTGLAPDFNPADAAKITLSWRKISTTLHREKDGVWRVLEREDHPADSKTVADFLDAFSRLKPLRPAEPADDEICSLLRVRPEEKDPKKTPGLLVRIADAKDRDLCVMTLGAGYFIKEPGPNDRDNVPDGRWAARIEKNGKVRPFLTASIFEEYHPMPGTWLNPPVFLGLGAATRVSFKNGSKVWMIQRKFHTDPFEPVFPDPDKPLSQRVITELFTLLSRRYTADAVRSDNESVKDIVPAGIFELEDSTGLIRKIYFYKLPKIEEAVLCRVEAVLAENPADRETAQKHADQFNAGRAGWLYDMPIRIYELFQQDPAGGKR